MIRNKLRVAIEAGLRRLPVARSAYAERDALMNRLLSADAKLAAATASLDAQIFPCHNSEFENNFVEMLIERYCTGNGLEIGPGKYPYGPRNRTKYLDKHTSNKDGTPNPDIVADASNIPICNAQFDFLISSHCLEHVPNTLRTLKEWARVIRPGGVLFLVLPHGDRTFDRHRAKTTLEHHIHDFDRLGEGKSDPTHFEEMKNGWLMNTETFEEDKRSYEKEWGAPIWDFKFRVQNDVLHYHVWTQSEMVDIVRYLGFKILYVIDYFKERADSFVVVSCKPS